jgi:hypothetical protein
MKAYNAEGRVVFEGNVHMRILPKTVKPEDREAPAPQPELKVVEIGTPQ